jgi:cytochrome c biogenesis protein CcmG/thiol:disulfide interchange protein DsbE
MKLFFTVFVVLSMACVLSAGELEKAPSFCLKSLDNETICIDSLIGNFVMVDFWAIYCKSCVEGLDAMKEVFAEFKEKNLIFLAISEDGPRNISKVPGFVKGHQWEYTVLYDPDQEVKNLFGIQAIPETYIIDTEGFIVYRHRGFKEGDEEDIKEKLKEFLPEKEENADTE